MVELINERLAFEVKAETEGGLALNGASAKVDKTKNSISDFGGSFRKDGEHVGSFHYAEVNGRVRFNLSDVDDQYYDECYQFVRGCVAEIKETVTK